MSEAMQNPYVGPRPFKTDESRLFFGRDQEVEALIPLVIAERLVLLYAQSGAGKSSLINARLIPGLRERSFQVLPVGRVSGEAAESNQASNVFVYNLLTRLDQGKLAAQELARVTIREYLANLDLDSPPDDLSTAPGETVHLDAPQEMGGVKPLALIIDQFEELFVANLEAWKQRKGFFEQLREAMDCDPFLWVVLVMREDYVAEIEPYAYLLPGHLRARFYMQRMGYAAALEAVRKPVETLRPFDPGVAEKLVDNLRLIAVSETGDDQPHYIEGEFVEPVQLQVVCHQLWENLKGHPAERITQDDLALLARGEDLAQFVNRALADFYEKAIGGVLQEKAGQISEWKLREWFSKELVTEAETRGSVFQGDKMTGSLPNELIYLLEARFIIRSEMRAARKWYELSHDRFINPILKANREWFDKHPRLVLADARAWESAGRPASRLYQGQRLKAAQEQLDHHPTEFSSLEREFIQAAQAVGEKNRSQRLRVVFVLLGVGLLVLGLLLANSIYQTMQAVTSREAEAQQRIIAQTQSAQAQVSRLVAESRLEEANTQRTRAETAQAEADAHRVEAEQQKTEALKQKAAAEAAQTQAEAGRLASLANYWSNSSLNLNLLYAVQGVTLFEDWETRSVLLAGLQRGIERPITADGSYIKAPLSARVVNFSPDGALIAVGLEQGSAMWNTDGHGRVENLPPELATFSPVLAVAFDSSGDYYAQADDIQFVKVWNRRTGKVDTLKPLKGKAIRPIDMAFQPGGKLLAIATEKNDQTPQGYLLIYDMQTREIVKQLDCQDFTCWAVAWSPDGKKLAVGGGGQGSSGGALQVVAVPNMNLVLNVQAHTSGVRSLAWFPDNQHLVSGGVDFRLVVWDTSGLSDARPREKSDGRLAVIRGLAVSPDGSTIFSSNGINPGIVAWDAATLERRAVIPVGALAVSSLAFNQQGNRFVAASYDGTIGVWSYAPLDSLSHPVYQTKISAPAAGLQIDDAGKLLAAQGQENASVTLSTADGQTGAPIAAEHSGLGFGRLDGKPVLLVGKKDGQVEFMDPASGAARRAPIALAPPDSGNTVRYPVLSQDGQLLAANICKANESCDTVAVWSFAKQNVVQVSLGTTNNLSALSISPEHTYLAAGSSNGTLTLMNLETGVSTHTQMNTSLTPTSLAFSPPGENLLAVGFANGEISLWEPSSLSPIGSFNEKTTGAVLSMLFIQADSGARANLVSLSQQGEIRQWVTDTRQWAARACALVKNRITPQELERFKQSSTGAPCP
jgi:WD40 repeat protein